MGGQRDDEFVNEHKDLVHSIVHKVKRQYGLGGDAGDLEAAGFRGLVEARSRFDEERGVKFSSFAYYRIRGAVLDEVRRMSALPRRLHARIRAAKAFDAAAEDLAADNGARRDTLSPNEARSSASDIAGQFITAFGLGMAATEEQLAPTPEEGTLRKERQGQLRAAVQTLPERERLLVEGYYFHDRPFQVVAAELGVSKSWASRLHSRALRLLRDAMQEEDIPTEAGPPPEAPLPPTE
jgi:RNA polymerase sigma factor for flagellar operon FliA